MKKFQPYIFFWLPAVFVALLYWLFYACGASTFWTIVFASFFGSLLGAACQVIIRPMVREQSTHIEFGLRQAERFAWSFLLYALLSLEILIILNVGIGFALFWIVMWIATLVLHVWARVWARQAHWPMDHTTMRRYATDPVLLAFWPLCLIYDAVQIVLYKRVQNERAAG